MFNRPLNENKKLDTTFKPFLHSHNRSFTCCNMQHNWPKNSSKLTWTTFYLCICYQKESFSLCILAPFHVWNYMFKFGHHVLLSRILWFIMLISCKTEIKVVICRVNMHPNIVTVDMGLWWSWTHCKLFSLVITWISGMSFWKVNVL